MAGYNDATQSESEYARQDEGKIWMDAIQTTPETNEVRTGGENSKESCYGITDGKALGMDGVMQEEAGIINDYYLTS